MVCSRIILDEHNDDESTATITSILPEFNLVNKKYTNWSLIDKGGDAIVYKAYNKDENIYVAIKQYKILNKDSIPITCIRETSLLKKNSTCKYIIAMKEVFYDKNFIYVVLDFAGRNILELMFNDTGSVDDKKKITLELIESINYLHSIGYIHGDINMKNVLFDQETKLTKLIDFCSSVRIHRKNIIYPPTIYVCPYELLLNRKNNDLKALDMWMLGCICYFLATKIPLFVSTDPHSQIEMIHQNIGEYNKSHTKTNISDINIHKPLNLIKGTPNEYIKTMLSLNPYKRKNISEIVEENISLYDKYNIQPSSNKIYMVDNNYVLNKCSQYDNVERLNLANNLFSKSNYPNNVHEIIFVVFKNMLRFKDNEIVNKIILCCHWMSYQLITGTEPSLSDKPNLNDILEVYNKLEYDVDPYTMYDYISYIPEMLQRQFIFLSFLLIIEPKFDCVKDICKIMIVYELLKSLNKIYIQELENLINEAKGTLQIGKNYLFELYLDVLSYLDNMKKNEKNNCLNLLFGSDITKWFNGIHFQELFEKTLRNYTVV